MSLWDVARGRCVRHFEPGCKYEKLLKGYSHKPHAHKASWFGASAQSGTIEVKRAVPQPRRPFGGRRGRRFPVHYLPLPCPMRTRGSSPRTPLASPDHAQITLEPGSAFNAEAYASDLGLASDADDVRLNLGERLLRALFAQWRQPDGAAPPAAARASAAPQPAALPELSFRPLDETPVRLSEDGRVVARTLASRLSELPTDAVPHWVAQAVLHGQYTPKEPLKMSFFLQPHPESGLPALPADCSKLSAAKVRPPAEGSGGFGVAQIRGDHAFASSPPGAPLHPDPSSPRKRSLPAALLFCPLFAAKLASLAVLPNCTYLLSPMSVSAAGAQGDQGCAVRGKPPTGLATAPAALRQRASPAHNDALCRARICVEVER